MNPCSSNDKSKTLQTFRNPILDEVTFGSSIIKHNGFYYMVWSRTSHLEIMKSPFLSNFRNAAERKEVFRPPFPEQQSVWWPRLFSIQGVLYIYFSIIINHIPGTSRMFVIPLGDPFGRWSSEVRLLPEEEIHATQGTVLQHKYGGLYLIWSGYPFASSTVVPGSSINLHICEMRNPKETIGQRIQLRTPTEEWERHVYPVLEWPSIIQNYGKTYLVFTASSCGSPNYCLGVMSIEDDKIPTVVSNWCSEMGKVFGSNEEELVWGTGMASFVMSPDDSELWMVYLASSDDSNHWQNKTPRIQKVEWEMSKPKFPLARGTHMDLVVPSGEI